MRDDDRDYAMLLIVIAAAVLIAAGIWMAVT